MWMIVSAQYTVDLNITWGHADAICVEDYWDKNTKPIITNIYCFLCDFNYIYTAKHRCGL
jgi:hypothetical protein